MSRHLLRSTLEAVLSHWGRDNMNAIVQWIFLYAFSLMQIIAFWLDYWRIYISLGPDELRDGIGFRPTKTLEFCHSPAQSLQNHFYFIGMKIHLPHNNTYFSCCFIQVLFYSQRSSHVGEKWGVVCEEKLRLYWSSSRYMYIPYRAISDRAVSLVWVIRSLNDIFQHHQK